MYDRYNELIAAICAVCIEDYTKAVASGTSTERQKAEKEQNGNYILRGYWFTILFSEEERKKIYELVTERAEHGEYYRYGKGWKRV